MGGSNCALSNCPAYKSKHRGLSFHKIPRKGENDAHRQLLIQTINREDEWFLKEKKDNAKIFICSRHYSSECYKHKSTAHTTTTSSEKGKKKSERNDINWNNSNNKKDVEDLQALLTEADTLAKEHRYEVLYQLLSPYKHVESDQLLWRLAQVFCAWAKLQGEKGDDHKRKALMEEGFTFAQRALKLNAKSASCHSWYATMLHYTSEFHGIKSHYLNAFTIRDHYEIAISLDPSDAVSLHSLGYWCFEFAHLPWYQKKILAVLFRTPPETTFEQALEYFYKAEEASPGFFNMNLVMAGRSHHHLHQYDKARDFFTRALRVVPQSPDERLAHAKATEMLKKMDHHHH